MDTTALPTIGDKITAIRCRYHSDLNGLPGVVADIMQGDPVGLLCDLTQPDGTVLRLVAVSEWEPRDEPINRWTTPMSYEVLREAHAELERQVSLLNRRVESLADQVANGHHAVEIIGNRLIREAEARDWCSDFDRIVDEVNCGLPGSYALPLREKEYEVTWTQTVTVTVDCSATFTARSASDAADMARDWCSDLGSDDIIEAVRAGNYEEDYDSESDFEVNEV